MYFYYIYFYLAVARNERQPQMAPVTLTSKSSEFHEMIKRNEDGEKKRTVRESKTRERSASTAHVAISSLSITAVNYLDGLFFGFFFRFFFFNIVFVLLFLLLLHSKYEILIALIILNIQTWWNFCWLDL